MVIVNRKSVFFLPFPDRVYAKSTGVYSYYVAASSQQQRVNRAFRKRDCRILSPLPHRSLVFCTRVKYLPPREIVIVYILREKFILSYKSHFSIRIRHYSNNLVSPFGWIIIRTSIFCFKNFSSDIYLLNIINYSNILCGKIYFNVYLNNYQSVVFDQFSCNVSCFVMISFETKRKNSCISVHLKQ